MSELKQRLYKLAFYMPAFIIKYFIIEENNLEKTGIIEYKIFNRVIFRLTIETNLHIDTKIIDLKWFGFYNTHSNIFYIQKKLEHSGFTSKIMNDFLKQMKKSNYNYIKVWACPKEIYYESYENCLGCNSEEDLINYYKKFGFLTDDDYEEPYPHHLKYRIK